MSNTETKWIGFLRARVGADGNSYWAIAWGRIFLVLALLASFAWGGKSAALFYYFQKVKEFEGVTWGQMVLFPLNRAEVREEFGREHLRKAREAFEEADYRNTLFYGRIGLARAPGDLEARLMLARLYANFDRPFAAEILQDGLRFEPRSEEYWGLFLNLLRILRKDEELYSLEIPEGIRLPIAQMIDREAVEASIRMGRYEDALSRLQNSASIDEQDKVLLLAGIDLRCERPVEALKRLEAFRDGRVEAGLAPVYRLISDTYLRLGNRGEALRYARLLSFAADTEVSARIPVMGLLRNLGLNETYETERESLMSRSFKDDSSMLQLAEAAARWADADLAQRLYHKAIQKGSFLAPFAVAYAEALINAGDAREMIKVYEEIQRENPSWFEMQRPAFAALLTVAAFQTGDNKEAEVRLEQLLQSRQVSPPMLLATAMRLNQLNAREAARRLAGRLIEQDPGNTDAAVFWISLAMERESAPRIIEQLEKLLELRRPAYPALRAFKEALGSDRFLFTPQRTDLQGRLAAVLEESNFQFPESS